MIRRLAATWAARSRHADRLWQGSSLLWSRLGDRATAWIRAGARPDLPGWRGRLGCWARILLLLLGLTLLWLTVRGARWLMWILTCWWIWRAWRAGRDTVPDPGEVTVERLAETPHSTPEEPPGTRMCALLRDLIGDRNGIHLSAVLDHLQERGHVPGWEVSDLSARLAALGIPVRPSLKVGRRVRRGVHRDALDAPSPAETPGGSATPTTAA